MRVIVKQFTVALLFLVTACQTSPTGRKQMALVPQEQVDAMGIQAFEDMKAQQPINRDPAVNAYVKCVANAIIDTQGDNQNWEVVVFENEQVNAFALPGGKIGVYTGLLKVAKTPSQLGAVLGHEVGHVNAHHGRERISTALAAEGVLAITSAILQDRRSKNYRLIMAALGLGAQIGVLLPFSRAQETEADIIGLRLMAQAGFDPRESVELWKNMSQAGGAEPPQILSTHPNHAARIRGLEQHMGEALAIYGKTSKRPNCRI